MLKSFMTGWLSIVIITEVSMHNISKHTMLVHSIIMHCCKFMWQLPVTVFQFHEYWFYFYKSQDSCITHHQLLLNLLNQYAMLIRSSSLLIHQLLLQLLSLNLYRWRESVMLKLTMCMNMQHSILNNSMLCFWWCVQVVFCYLIWTEVLHILIDGITVVVF